MCVCSGWLGVGKEGLGRYKITKESVHACVWKSNKNSRRKTRDDNFANNLSRQTVHFKFNTRLTNQNEWIHDMTLSKS